MTYSIPLNLFHFIDKLAQIFDDVAGLGTSNPQTSEERCAIGLPWEQAKYGPKTLTETFKQGT